MPGVYADPISVLGNSMFCLISQGGVYVHTWRVVKTVIWNGEKSFTLTPEITKTTHNAYVFSHKDLKLQLQDLEPQTANFVTLPESRLSPDGET